MGTCLTLSTIGASIPILRQQLTSISSKRDYKRTNQLAVFRLICNPFLATENILNNDAHQGLKMKPYETHYELYSTCCSGPDST